MFNPKTDQTSIDILSQAAHLETQVEAFLIDRKAQNMSKHTLKYYRGGLKMFCDFCETQAITQITQLTSTDIRTYLLWLSEKGHNEGGVHLGFGTLRTFLYWWEEENEPAHWKNPIRKVKAPRMPTEPLEPVEIPEVQSLLNTCKRSTFYGDRDRAIFLVLLDSGGRASELCNLDLADIDLTDGSILVRQGKGRKPRTTFAGKQARKAIRSWMKHRAGKPGALFTTDDGERLTYWGLRQIIRRRSGKAGICEPSAHDFRRAFCLAQLQAGVPETTIARLMGHTSNQLIARYAKQTKRNLGEGYKSVADDEL